MKRDKRLQNYADGQLAKYDDEEFKQRLLDKQKANAIAKKKFSGRRTFALGAVATALVVAIIATVLLSLYLPIPTEPDKVYMFDNIKNELTTLQVLNDTTKTLDISSNAESMSIWRHYDEDYNMDLYFTAEYINDEYFATAKFVIVVEQSYNYSIEDYDYKFSININGYNVSYVDNVKENGPVFEHTVRATFTTATEVVYVKFTQTTIGEDNDFEEVLALLLV